MGSPLNTGDRLCGVACLSYSTASPESMPCQEDIELLHALTAQAGLATERGELMQELLTRGRLAAMGETVAAISHGIKNILQGLRGGADAVQLALERKDLELADRGWPIVARNLERIQALTMNMLGFARQRALERERMPVEPVILEAMEMLEALTSRSQIDIKFEPEDGVPPIPIDTASILQILINLISNAADSSPKQSTVTLPPRLRQWVQPGQDRRSGCRIGHRPDGARAALRALRDDQGPARHRAGARGQPADRRAAWRHP